MQKFSGLKRFIIATAVVGVAIAAAAPPAEAAFLLNLSDGVGNSATITDGGAAVFTGTASGALTDIGAGAGIVVWTGSVGVFTVNVDTGISKPILGDANTAVMDLAYISISNGAGTLLMVLSDTGFSQGVGQPGVLTQSLGGTQPPGQTTLLRGFKDLCNNGVSIDPINGRPSTTTCQDGILSSGWQTFTDTPFAGAASLAHGVIPNDYAMILAVQIVSDGAQIQGFSGNAELVNSAVPEPGSMVLLGAGLLGLARKARRKYAQRG